MINKSVTFARLQVVISKKEKFPPFSVKELLINLLSALISTKLNKIVSYRFYFFFYIKYTYH